MPGAAEYRTAANKGSNLVRCEVDARNRSFVDLDVEIQFAHAKAMGDIRAPHLEVDRLTLAYGNFGGLKGISFCCHLDVQGSSGFCDRWPNEQPKSRGKHDERERNNEAAGLCQPTPGKQCALDFLEENDHSLTLNRKTSSQLKRLRVR